MVFCNRNHKRAESPLQPVTVCGCRPQKKPEGKLLEDIINMKLIGIIGAMEVEVASLKEMMTDVTIRTKASMEFNHGYLNGKEVVVVRSGIGKVNAGMDVRIFGYPLGEIPQMGVLSFPADEHLAEVAEEVCKEVNPEIQVFRGRVVSGDQFISSKEVKNHLIEEFNGSCAEMEGAAIAQGAYLNKIPYVVLRAISDKADDSATMDYPTFESEAARHCVNLLQEMVKRL